MKLGELSVSSFKVALVAMDDDEVPDCVYKSFADAGIEFVQEECVTASELSRVAADADLVWIFGGGSIVSAETIPLLKNCGAIIRTGSGTDNIPVGEATALGIVVANTPGAHDDEVSDHAIGLMFALIRKIALHDRKLRSGVWEIEGSMPNHHVVGQTLGLVGFGHIARLVAKKMRGFEMTILCSDPFVSSEEMSANGVESATLDTVMSRSDFVSLHSPLTSDTHHLIGKRELDLMKPDGVLINTSRGSVVDEAALVQVLMEKKIAGVGLDVFEEEPASSDNPLLKLDNVVVTPHTAGQSDLSHEKQWRLSVETAISFSKGRWPRSYVNRGVNPRWELSYG
jgi:D-3-phosphoglycerate dehydrogenase